MATKRPSLSQTLRATESAAPAPAQSPAPAPAEAKTATGGAAAARLTPGKTRAGRARGPVPATGRAAAPAVVTKISAQLVHQARAAHAADHAAGRTQAVALEAWVDQALAAHTALTCDQRAAVTRESTPQAGEALLTRRYRLEQATNEALDAAVEADKAQGIPSTRGALARDAIAAAVARATTAEGGTLPQVSDEVYERAVTRTDTKQTSRAGEAGVTVVMDKASLDAARDAYWYAATRPGAEGLAFREWVDAAIQAHTRATPSTRQARVKRLGAHDLEGRTFPRRFPLSETTASDMLAAIRADRADLGLAQSRTAFALDAIRVAVARTRKAADDAGHTMRPAPDPLPTQPA